MTTGGAGIQAQGRDADAALAGVPGGSSRRVWLHVVLREVCRLSAPGASDLPPPPRGGRSEQTDYAGPTLEVVDPQTGEIRHAQIFVAVLGASSLTFAMASFGQRLPRLDRRPDGGPVVPRRCTQSDRLLQSEGRGRQALWFEPTLNQTFAAMAEHYDTTILPTRSRKPRDKAIASYCTSSWWLCGDRCCLRFAGAAAAAAFKDSRI